MLVPQHHGARLVVISGPSGVGKDSAIKRVLAQCPHARKSVSFTTRAPRGDEVDGVHYRFVNPNEFCRIRDENGFLEWKEVHGNFYGTPRLQTECALAEGRSVILAIDVQGAMEVMKHPGTASVFLMPPSFAELQRRLTGRKEDSLEAIERRLRAAAQEVFQAVRFPYVILAEDKDGTAAQLVRVVRGEHLGQPPDLCERIKRFVLDSSP